MEIAYLVLGLTIGALAAYLICKGKSGAAAALLEAAQRARENERRDFITQIAAAKADGEKMLYAQKQEADSRLADCRRDYEQRIYDIKTENDANVDRLKREADARDERINKDHAETLAKTRKEMDERRDKELTALRKSYDEQLTLFKEQLTTATENLLKQRSGELQTANTHNMEQLFAPIRENISRMEKSINDTREANARNNATFEETIRQMMESNARLGSQADRLSTALQRKNKTAGDWGELILTELLESQGLEQGVHFDVQQTLRDLNGKTLVNDDSGLRMRPDVILHLADNRDVVVDSKMSLTAFVEYQNAMDETERQDALRRHIDSVRKHVLELSAKNYSNYIRKSSGGLDFVIMFVPIEGALQLALSQEPELWRKAFDKHVFIAGAQTLIAALRIIDLTWVNVKQERNTAKVMEEARKLIDRVDAFYREFKSFGARLDDASKAYNAVAKRVSEGSQSILATGRRMEQLGARGKKPLEITDEEN